MELNMKYWLPLRFILFFLFLFSASAGLFLLTVSLAQAQSLPVDVTVTASSPTAPADVTVVWTSPAGSICNASGDWSGTKTASGTQVIPAVPSGVKNYTLGCSQSTGGANLSWTAPTKNEDGTTLTNLAKHQVFTANSSAGVASANPIDVPMPAVTYSFTSLPVETRYFGVKAVNSANTSSNMSVIVNKAITGSTGTDTASITLATKPMPPTVLTIDTVGYAVKPNTTKLVYELDGAVGTVPLGVPCDIARNMNDADEYYAVNRAQYVTWTTGRRPNVVVAKCSGG